MIFTSFDGNPFAHPDVMQFGVYGELRKDFDEGLFHDFLNEMVQESNEHPCVYTNSCDYTQLSVGRWAGIKFHHLKLIDTYQGFNDFFNELSHVVIITKKVKPNKAEQKVIEFAKSIKIKVCVICSEGF